MWGPHKSSSLHPPLSLSSSTFGERQPWDDGPVAARSRSARQGEREREESGGGDGGEGVERDGGILPAAGRVKEAPDGGEPAAPHHTEARHRHRRLRDLPRQRGHIQPPLPPIWRPPPPLDRVGGHARRPALPPLAPRQRHVERRPSQYYHVGATSAKPPSKTVVGVKLHRF
uniref:Uncharacterized protein n=1 Tax=Oryza sativa subsp. japonica TaxID=39947 RepID=Q6ZF06_ORYSJ|nr:unknown protein [Oryza sativa Japonica Group]